MTFVKKEKSEAVTNSFTLPNKRIRLVPIVRRDSFMNNVDHDGKFMFTGCSHSFVVPMNARTGRLIDPLTTEERKFLEDELLIDLNVNSPKCFYREHNILIKKTSLDLASLFLELDLSKPMDYLDYKILLLSPVIANSWSERFNNWSFEWALQDLGEEHEQAISLAELKMKAYAWFSNNDKSKTKMYDFLRVYGINIGVDSDISFMKKTIVDLIETPKKLRKMIDIINDKDFETRLFIDKAIRIGEITRVGTHKYALLSGDVIGNTLSETIKYVKDPLNSVIISSIQDKIEHNKA